MVGLLLKQLVRLLSCRSKSSTQNFLELQKLALINLHILLVEKDRTSKYERRSITSSFLEVQFHTFMRNGRLKIRDFTQLQIYSSLQDTQNSTTSHPNTVFHGHFYHYKHKMLKTLMEFSYAFLYDIIIESRENFPFQILLVEMIINFRLSYMERIIRAHTTLPNQIKLHFENKGPT